MANIEEKIDKMMNHMEAIKHLLINLNDNLELTNEKIDNMERKLNKLDVKIEEDILDECKKMGSHIDFVEEVYDNVKHPLGYIVKKIKYLTVGGDSTQYTLTNINKQTNRKYSVDEYLGGEDSGGEDSGGEYLCCED